MFKSQYDGEFEVLVDEEEAREAFPDFKEAMDVEGDFEDHKLDAAEWVAREKLAYLVNEVAPDLDILLERGECRGTVRE